jgi:broad specificity phosphatase PhoE
VGKTVLLVRHGEALGSAPRTLLGRTDTPLSEEGRRQAAGIVNLLPPEGEAGGEILYLTSPLLRATETAAIATAGRRVDFQLDPDLVEIDFGEWEGRRFPELRDLYPEQVERWSNSPLEFTFPGGENLSDFWARMTRVGRRIAAADAGFVIVFTHGGVVRALICHFLGLELRHYVVFDVRLAAVATLRLWGDRGTLVGLAAEHSPAWVREG